MTPRRALCLLAILWLGHAAALADPIQEAEVLRRWRDPAVLAPLLEEACDAVERATGATFTERPRIEPSSQDEIERILNQGAEGERGMLESTPDATRAFFAYFEPLSRTIHLVPEALVAVARAAGDPALLSDDVLRSILVHEATHALDFERFPVRWVLACCSASDERLAIEAVLEGHAQLVAEQVAKERDASGAFERLTHLYTGRVGGEDGGMVDPEAAFTYVQGHRFAREILDTKGRAALEALLRDPPCETRVIDRPELAMDPLLKSREPDLQAVLELFRSFVTRPGWEVSKWRLLGPTAPSLGGEEGDERSYLDNHGLYGGTEDGMRYVNVFLASTPSKEEAEALVAALRAVDEGRDREAAWLPAERTEGTGTDGGLPGFTSRRRARRGGAATDLMLHVARVGNVVVEYTSYGVPPDRAQENRFLDLTERLLEAPPATAAAIHLRGMVTAFLRARAEDDQLKARELMRDLLPSTADLRRVVRPEDATAFADGYPGLKLALRTTIVSDATVASAFAQAGPTARVRAWGATTEDLVKGRGHAARFPAPMRTFARERAAPGVSWVLLTVTDPQEGDERVYCCFARLGDRFLWIDEPWRASAKEPR